MGTPGIRHRSVGLRDSGSGSGSGHGSVSARADTARADISALPTVNSRERGARRRAGHADRTAPTPHHDDDDINNYTSLHVGAPYSGATEQVLAAVA